MKGQRVLVTGGAGVIGLELVPRLLSRGATVFVGDLKPRPASFASGVEYRQGDLNTLTAEEMERWAPEVIIHLAATFERSAETCDFWEENFWHNVRLSNHLMTLAKKLASLRRVVFASSYLIYDPALYQFSEAQSFPVALKESDAVLPRNLTGMAKLAHEIELRFLAQFDDLNLTSTCARIYRGYGCGSRDVISRWIRALLNGETLEVYRPEGIFDYIYAGDSAEGLIRLSEAESTPPIVNLGTGRSRRVSDILEALRRSFPNMLTRVVDSDIPYEASQADVTLLEKTTGWRPTSELEDAIAEMVEYETQAQSRSVAAPVLGGILVSSSSAKAPLIESMRQAAKRIDPNAKIFAGDVNPDAISQYVADDFWQMPATREEAVESIVEGCEERQIRTVLPTRDGELLFWARHKDRLARAGIHVLVSDEEPIRRCLDKLSFARFASEQGFPAIPTSEEPEGTGPFVVKERFGAGAREIGLDLDREAARQHAEVLERPIYQPMVRGREISADCWLDSESRAKGVVLRTRDTVVRGESQVTTTFRNERIESTVARLAECLQLRGHAIIQMFIDERGDPHIIECNPRFGGASTTSIAAGLDSFVWSLLERLNSSVQHEEFRRRSYEVKQIRIAHDIRVVAR